MTNTYPIFKPWGHPYLPTQLIIGDEIQFLGVSRNNFMPPMGIIVLIKGEPYEVIDLRMDTLSFSIRFIKCQLNTTQEETEMTKIKLGMTARDIITGFSGIVTAHATYLTGCDQYCLKPRDLDKEGVMKKGVWFDVEQIEVTNNSMLKINARPTGGPRMDCAPSK